MNEIRALDTYYKGYKFRSRLEARWAIFFDNAGIKWQYEAEPLCVGGDVYLPDFKLTLPDVGEIYHEVKPENARESLSIPAVYLAGKVSSGNEWRGEAASSDRDARLGVYDGDLGGQKAWLNAARIVSMNGVPFRTVGPFPSSCDHGCSHNPASLHMAETCSYVPPTSIVRACRGSIAGADLICAHINAADAFGTLVELGLASAMGKPISLTIEHHLCRLLERRQWYEGHNEDPIVSQSHDLWFIETMVRDAFDSQTHRVEDDKEARDVHAKYISLHSGRYAALIAKMEEAGLRLEMTFGDPLEVTLSRKGLLAAICSANMEAARIARQFRFDRR